MFGRIGQAFLFLGVLASGAPGRAGGEPLQASAPSIDQWMSLKGADNPALSPDGRFVAYTIRSADWEANGFDDEIWIAQVASKELYQLTDAKGSSRDPAWSPDGKRLAFLSTRGGSTQIYVASPPDRSAAPLTEVANGVDDFKWSADGRSIAFTTSEAAKNQKSRDETNEYRVVGDDPVSTTILWRINVVPDVSRKPTPEQLTDGVDFAVDDFAWSPDSRRIAFSANHYADPYPFWTYDIYVLNLGDKAIRKIVDRTGPDFFPVWSPDGKQIAYRTYVVTDKDEYFTFSAGYIAVVPADGGPSRVLTEEFDENPTPRAWSSEGIYFTAGQRTYQHLFRVNPATRSIERVSQPDASVFSGFSFSSDFRLTAFVGQDAKNYPEICVSGLTPFAPRRLTKMSDQLEGWKIGTREVVQWTSKDGTPIEGVLIKPADFDPARKYPLLVILHGGPVAVDQATIGRDLPYPAELFVARGALVLRPNYRGSSAYGRKFRALLVRNLGLPQSQDVITGVDFLIAKGIVDPSRVGAMGWSAGGALAAFLATTSDRFRAITVGEGVSDWRLFYTVGGGSTLKPDSSNTTPWDDPEYYQSISALTYVKKARTPTLIQHRESDPVAPTVSAQELYRALKDQGVPVKMVIYKGAGHLPSGLKQFRAVVEHNDAWFRRWIWNE